MMNLYEVARFLEAHDNYDILTHAYPDGDTLGSGFALGLALRRDRQRQNAGVSETHRALPADGPPGAGAGA